MWQSEFLAPLVCVSIVQKHILLICVRLSPWYCRYTCLFAYLLVRLNLVDIDIADAVDPPQSIDVNVYHDRIVYRVYKGWPRGVASESTLH